MAGGQPRLLSRALMRPRARGRAAAAGHWLIVMIASFNMVKYMYLGKVYSITIQQCRQCDAEILPSNSSAILTPLRRALLRHHRACRRRPAAADSAQRLFIGRPPPSAPLSSTNGGRVAQRASAYYAGRGRGSAA